MLCLVEFNTPDAGFNFYVAFRGLAVIHRNADRPRNAHNRDCRTLANASSGDSGTRNLMRASGEIKYLGKNERLRIEGTDMLRTLKTT